MTRFEDIVKSEGRWWIIGVDMKRAWPAVFYRNLVLPAVFAAAISFPLTNIAIYHLYKTLVEGREESGGTETALVYARDSVSELEKEVSPVARSFFLGAEYYLHKYISDHQK